ncbi:MAG: leucine--tRNA ligase [Planctomycetota bacterium]
MSAEANPTTDPNAPKPHRYDFTTLEAKWQAHWETEKTFAVPNPGDGDFSADKPKFYVLDMFPYPSGVGLHVGHPLGYIATDIVGRYQRMRGYNVLHPMGFDAFGLPAEQYAVEHNVHPRITTEKNIENMVRQLKQLGLGYDWDRCLATTDPGYVKWTQWIFLRLYQSYFDPVESKAMPIASLREKLAGEDYLVRFDGQLVWSGIDEDMAALTGGTGSALIARKWHELPPEEREAVIDNHRLAYMADVEVNWCAGLGTVLANEEVTNDGRSERGNFPVVKRPLKQWMLRITAYADRLIDDLDGVDWPEPVKLLQRNWIGKSHGAQVDFAVAESDEKITVFTTRPDTLFGATYMVLAPEHELVNVLTTDQQRDAVNAYRKQAGEKTSVERQQDAKEKTGVFTGAYAINPVNNQQIPIWIADYVMMGYGTGAIMAVPAHDERDHAFATKFEIPIVEVIAGGDVTEHAFAGNGKLVNSSHGDLSLDGLDVPAAKERITAWLEEHKRGHATTNYKLRDWLFSRQRYWGEPFPILHGPSGEIVALDEGELPVELPEMDDFKPQGSDDPNCDPAPPLGRAGDDWKYVERDGVRYTRELNTMPNWAGSCWYYLRYLDPHNDDALVAPEVEQYWMRSEKKSGGFHNGGVDLYVGGVEHAVLHLLYARFWHKVLFDLGHVSTPEPFGRLYNQGYIQAFYYEDDQGVRVPADEVVETNTGKRAGEVQDRDAKDCAFVYDGRPVKRLYGKMGKSLKNAIAPDDICEKYGCDTLRLYEMYLGPLDQSKVWNTADIVGVHRFLNRLWRNFVNEDTGELKITRDNPSDELLRLTHQTIKRVTEAMDGMQFNVAIAALIELNNALVSLDDVPHSVALAIVPMLAPLAPHVAEELWEKLGHVVPHDSVANAEWPEFRAELLVSDTVELPVQVNGKLRGTVTVPADADQTAIEEAAKAEENVALHLEGKTIRKVIVIPKKLVNLVVG